MLLFRSEEHLGRWLHEHDLPRGATMSLDQQWRLARAWYANRMSPDWRRRSPDEIAEVFASIGLTGDFWALSP